MLAMKMLKDRRYFLLACQLGILGTLVAWNNVFGIDYKFYERFAWWDIVSHMLGGLWVGLFVAWFASHRTRSVARIFGAFWAALFAWAISSFDRHTVFWCVTSAVVFGVGWEVYEYFAGLQFTTNPWPIEVEIAKDLLDDAIGGFVAGYFVSRKRL